MAKKRKEVGVKGEQFSLIDSQGRVRALFEIDPVPAVASACQFFDKDGNPRISCQIIKDEPTFTLYHRDCVQAISFGVHEDGGTGFSIYRPDGTIAVSIGVDSDGVSSISLLDETGRIRVHQLTGKTE